MPDREAIRAWLKRVFGSPPPVPEVPGAEPLIRCAACRARRVVPVDWSEESLDSWRMRLRCGECGATRDVVASDGEAEQFGQDLDAGLAELAADLRQIERDRMASEVDTLVAALERDLIDAGDFER